MFCGKCGAQNEEDALFCKDCGAALENADTQASAADCPGANSGQKAPPIRMIIFVVLIIAGFFVYRSHNSPVNQLKAMVFDDYTTEELATTVNRSLRGAKWKKEKIEKDYYQVTVSGYCESYKMHIAATFDYYIYDEYTCAIINHAIVNGSYVDESLSKCFIMAILCDNAQMAQGFFWMSALNS